MKLRDTTALVTGGCGPVGAAIVDCLIRSEGVARVRVIDRSVGAHADRFAGLRGAVELVEADIRYWDDVRPHFDAVDVVFHQATVSAVAGGDDWRACHEALVGGTLNVARACVEAGVRKLVSASSASVYGLPDVFPTPEDHHLANCRTWDGAACISSEAYLRAFRDAAGLNYVVLRYYDVYGDRAAAGDTPSGMLTRWSECLLRNKRPRVFGDGTRTMDLVHVEDVALANVLAARGDVDDEVFNVASGNEISIRDLLQMLLRVTAREDVEPEFLPERAVVRIPRKWADLRRITRRLRFEPQVSLEEGLRRVMTACRRRMGWAAEAAHDVAAAAERARSAVAGLRSAGRASRPQGSAKPTAEDAAPAPRD